MAEEKVQIFFKKILIWDTLRKKKKDQFMQPREWFMVGNEQPQGQVLYADEVIRHFHRNGRSFISVVVGESIAVAMDWLFSVNKNNLPSQVGWTGVNGNEQLGRPVCDACFKTKLIVC